MAVETRGELAYFVTCADCPTEGPSAPGAMAARQAARDTGWSRCYRGSGEQFRCPDCRNGITPEVRRLRAAVLDLYARIPEPDVIHLPNDTAETILDLLERP